MGDFAQRLEKAALLSGVGTLIRRAYPEKGFPSDEAAGNDFLRPFFDVTGADFAAAQGADFSRILHEASYLAAGTEGAAAEDGAGVGDHLASVFNGFGDEAGSPTVFPVCEWTGDVARLPYPQPVEKARPSREAYQRLAEGLKEAFCCTPISQMTPEALGTLLERFMSYVPSAEARIFPFTIRRRCGRLSPFRSITIWRGRRHRLWRRGFLPRWKSCGKRRCIFSSPGI